jgi:putative heme-binding domain-containing protein
MRYRSGAAGFGREFADHWFMTQFNTHKVVRTVLTRHGGTFRAEVHEFLSSPSGDFHPTDVLEDADGSLLVIDTGGWFLRGCPTSQIAKPSIKGAIWRISKKDAKKVDDPRGLKIAWDKLSADELGRLFDDARFAIAERAADQLSQLDDGLEVAEKQLNRATASDGSGGRDGSSRVARHAVWALTRMRSEKATRRMLVANRRLNDSVRLSIIHALAEEIPPKSKAEASSLIVPMNQAEIRAAAAIPGMRFPRPRSGEILEEFGQIDRITQHAIVFNLIERDSFERAREDLAKESKPDVRVALLLGAAQMRSSKLAPEDVLPLLVNDDFALRKTAAWVVTKHPEWAEGVGEALGDWLARPKFGEDDAVAVRGALVAFGADDSLQKKIAESLAKETVSPTAQRVLLEAIGEMQGRPWPTAWQREVEKKIAGDDPLLSITAIQAVVSAEEAAFAPTLASIADDKKRLTSERVAAMQGLVKFGRPLSDAGFELLVGQLAADDAPSRLTAARTLGGAMLTNEQLQTLAGKFTDASPLEAIPLLTAFERSDDAKLGETLVANLMKSRAVAALPSARIQELIAHYPDETQKAAADLLKLVSTSSGQQSQRLDELLASTEKGDAKRGRDVFLSRQAACANCHRVGSDGGTVGPDLSTVGARRERRDLLEAIALPSASLARGYESYTLTTTAGKIHTGLIVRQTPETLVLRTPDQTEVRLPRSEIDEMQPSPLSIMPQGLDRTLSPEEFADLLAYLATLR